MDDKKSVGIYAASLVKDGDIVGLGTGSTTAFTIIELGRRIKEEGISIYGIPTSFQAKLLAVESKIPVTTLDEHDIDIAIDGADEVDPTLSLLKGRGGALLQEKIIDYNANRFVVVCEERKLVEKLGKFFPVTIEVFPLAYRKVFESLSSFGKPVLRNADNKDGPVMTDNGNFIIDLFTTVENPKSLEKELNDIPGIFENGIFTSKCEVVFIKNGNIVSLKS
ncbi:MAG: ribose 5-phosphate isomerase A [Candidatus Methanofastidiosum sp.]|nr:ribose 5-phosphate isomerase A [Methanofastidiosum sp.]